MAPNDALARAAAHKALNGRGDEKLGEWEEWGQTAFHLRRRLSDAERKLAGGIEVRDIRGTPEQIERETVVASEVPGILDACPWMELSKQRIRP